MSAITPDTLQTWLQDGEELALFDVREAGQFGEGHLFFAVPLPYSRLELDAPRLAPRRQVRIVLVDDDGSLSRRAAARLDAIGYTNVAILQGGLAAWTHAGYRLFAGVNVPSKTFGEIVESACHTPSVSAHELNEMMARRDNFIILDGRPLNEFRKMNIPGAICCPNGELPYRVGALAPDPRTTIVINCAGRTRSIIGAQTLINLGVANPIYALENGTQGWYLNDFELEHGNDRRYPEEIARVELLEMRQRAVALAQATDVKRITSSEIADWLTRDDATVFLCDVRSEAEFLAGTLPGAQHTPGGQLVQATDQYIGVRHARIVLFDDQGIRSYVTASWLRQLGHQAYVLDESLEVAAPVLESCFAGPSSTIDALPPIDAYTLHDMLEEPGTQVIDVRSSAAYRASHIPGARWSIRPRITQALAASDQRVIMVADDDRIAALAALDLPASVQVSRLDGGLKAWVAAGYPTRQSPDNPPDEARIDYLFFVHDRHDGNKEAARQYLAWELGLVAQLDDYERAQFQPLMSLGTVAT